ncbi:hypothetical protein ABIA39_000274 [Nocardia sp. GAS34]
MKNNTTHDEDGAIRKGAKVSGNAYVSVRLRDTNSKAEKILFRSPDKCNHEATICRDCAESWSWDHTIGFDRTAAGRRLRAEIEAHTQPSAELSPRPTMTDASPIARCAAPADSNSVNSPHTPDS